MTASIAIQNSDLDFDNGTFDSSAFASAALAGLAVSRRGHRSLAPQAGRNAQTGRNSLR